MRNFSPLWYEYCDICEDTDEEFADEGVLARCNIYNLSIVHSNFSALLSQGIAPIFDKKLICSCVVINMEQPQEILRILDNTLSLNDQAISCSGQLNHVIIIAIGHLNKSLDLSTRIQSYIRSVLLNRTSGMITFPSNSKSSRFSRNHLHPEELDKQFCRLVRHAFNLGGPKCSVEMDPYETRFPALWDAHTKIQATNPEFDSERITSLWIEDRKGCLDEYNRIFTPDHSQQNKNNYLSISPPHASHMHLSEQPGKKEYDDLNGLLHKPVLSEVDKRVDKKIRKDNLAEFFNSLVETH